VSEPDGAPVVVVTDRHQVAQGARGLVEVVRGALAGGATRVLLRDKDLDPPERVRLADELRVVTAAAGAALLVAGDVDLACAVGADGVHLAADDPWPQVDHPLAVGRSCHDHGELVEARVRAADWATYSPVFASVSKPGYGPALGLAGLAAGCRAVPGLPVLALGGIGPGRARPCLDAGAAGVAVMGAVMRADDPATVVRALVDEMRGADA
jgi:thiamine-phosphate pyrophosphorylase